jgi:hypothetical protein
MRDVRISTTGAAIDETYNLGLYQVRAYPKSDLSIPEIDTIKNNISIGLHPKSAAPTRNITQKEIETTKDNLDFGESVIVNGADKIFFLSWNSTQMLQNKMSKYGFSQDEIYQTLQKNTEPMVKGNLLLKLLVDILNLIEQHGHAGIMLEGGNTLNEGAKTLLKNIKENYALFDPVAKDLSGGALLLNQYLRLN